jgi:integrase
MAMPKMLLSAAIDDYLEAREVDGYSKNTLANNKVVLKRLLTTVGNIYVENLTSKHITQTLKELRTSRSDQSMNQAFSNLKNFFGWCITDARCLTAGRNPMTGKKAPKFMAKERRRIPVYDFDATLDAAANPRDRILLALATYLLKRSCEIAGIRIGDVDLSGGRVKVVMTKTDKEERMPIVQELDVELRRWMIFYASQCGELQDEWFLVPAYTRPKIAWDPVERRHYCDFSIQRLNPTRPIGRTDRITNRVFQAVGFPTTDAEGRTTREGMHTFRRSGATALYERFEDHDRARDIVQSMLGHQNASQTEAYIGADSLRAARDKALLGQVMYPGLRGENVRRLRAVSEGDG